MVQCFVPAILLNILLIISGKELVDQIFEYSRTNLALVNVYIKNPVVSRIRSYCVEVILYI